MNRRPARPIPPQYCEAEALPPPGGALFQKHPAASIAAGDLVMLGTELYRVKLRYADPRSPRIVFVLYPYNGGLIIRQAFFPRQWLPSVLQDTDGDTRPMPPMG